MATNDVLVNPEKREHGEQGITNPSNQEAPPPYSGSAPNYGAAQESSPPPYDQSQMLEPPPSYDSLYGQVRAAKQDSSSTPDFFKKFFVIIVGTLGCTVCVGLVLAIPVSMIVMGSLYLSDCPIQKYIPIYLIVGGCFGVVKNMSSVVQRVRNRQEDRDAENAKTNPFDGTLNCFLLAWFIAGNVWIYRIYGHYDGVNENSDYYCNPVLYEFAFWLTTSFYIISVTMVCCVCCVGGLAACCSGGSSSSAMPNP